MIKTKESISEIIHDKFCIIYEILSKKKFVLESSLEAYFLQSCKYALWGKSKERKLENLEHTPKNHTYLQIESTDEFITPEKKQFFKQYILPKLSARKRRILELTYEGYSNPEIAEILGNKVNAIKVAKAQALKTAKEIAKKFPNFFEE